MTRLYGWEYITAREYGRMAVWVHGCMIVEMYECMYGKYASALKLGLVTDGVWVCMSVSIWRERHRCKRNDHHHRPELHLQAQSRGIYTRVAEEAHTDTSEKTAGTESVTRKCADKKSQTPPYTQERPKAHYIEPKDTVIAKDTDKRAHAHKRQKGTGTVIGTETGNVMAQGRLKGHSHTGTRQQQKGHLHRKGHIHKHSKKVRQEK